MWPNFAQLVAVYQFGALRRNVNAIETGHVFAQNLPLDLQGQRGVVLLLQVVGDVIRHEFLNQPLGGPDRIVAPEAQLVWPQPEQQIGHNFAEVTRAQMHKSHGHGQSGVDVRFLRGDPAKIVQARQPNVLHNEIQCRKVGGRVIDVVHIEGITAQGVDRGALVDMNIFDTQFLGQLQILVGPGVVEAPAT